MRIADARGRCRTLRDTLEFESKPRVAGELASAPVRVDADNPVAVDVLKAGVRLDQPSDSPRVRSVATLDDNRRVDLATPFPARGGMEAAARDKLIGFKASEQKVVLAAVTSFNFMHVRRGDNESRACKELPLKVVDRVPLGPLRAKRRLIRVEDEPATRDWKILERAGALRVIER